MKPNKGLTRNYKLQDQPPGTIVYGKNGVSTNTGAIQNEKGFTLCSASIPYQVMGGIETDGDPILFSTDNYFSAIGFYNEEEDTYTPIFDDAYADFKLGFHTDYPIQGEARRNYKNEVEVAWRDGKSVPRFCNTSHIGTDLNDFSLFPEYRVPNIHVNSTSGGSLPVATYFVALKYVNVDGTETRYAAISSPISLRAEEYLPPGSSSSKGLTIQLSDLDLSYDRIQLAILKRVNGVTTATELEPMGLSQSSMEVNILVTKGTDLTLEEVLIPPAFYVQAGSITQLNDVLYLADLEEAASLELQYLANTARISIQSKIRKIDPVNPDRDIIEGSFRTFKHGEVYAFYIVFLLKSGQRTRAFHVPGMPAPGWLDEVVVDGQRYETFQVQDTVTDVISVDAYTKCMTPGIWANKHETYPDHPQFKDHGLTGRVRHHRMPSAGYTKSLFKAGLPSDYKYGVNCLDYLGVRLENVVIPAALQSTIVGYELHYAKRTYENSLIAGQGCVLFGSKIKAIEIDQNIPGIDTFFTTGGNFDSSVTASNFDDYEELWTALVVKATQFVRVHSPELQIIRPGISPNMLRFNYSLKASVSKSYRDETMMSFKVDYTGASGDYTGSESNFNRGFSSGSYIPNMGVVGNMNNLKGEPTYFGKLAGGLVPLAVSKAVNTISGGHIPKFPEFEETHIVDVITIKDNLYSAVHNQDLVRIGAIEPSTRIIGEYRYTGDCFVCIDSFYSHGLIDGIETGEINTTKRVWDDEGSHDNRMEPTHGNKVIRLYLCESTINLWQRYKDPALPTSAFYPQTSSADYIRYLDRTVDNNMYAYDRSASSVGDLVQGLKAYSVDDIDVTKDPFRIARSLTQSREGRKNNWKQFSALDYFETQKDMGPITNIQGYDDRLIIHHRNALFITQDKTTLQGDILSVTLGSGDIFRFPPKQGKTSKLGYAGTQHRLAAVLNDFGYVFVDAEAGSFFALNEEGLQDLSTGLQTFLQKHMTLKEENVFSGAGVTIGYDKINKRVMLTVKQEETSFTVSYNTLKKEFDYYHDYYPDYYLHTRKHIYALKHSKLYQMNTGTYGVYFDQEDAKSFFIDVVFNSKHPMILNSVNWQTEVTLQDYSDESQVTRWDETLTSITIWNNYQCTGKIMLDNDVLTLLDRNNRNVEQKWSLSDFRNLIAQTGQAFLTSLFTDFQVKGTMLMQDLPWYDKGLMEGTFFVVRFEFANRDNRQITIHDVDLSVSTFNAPE